MGTLYSIEPSHRGGSNEYPQSIFRAKIRKNITVFHFNTFIFSAVKFTMYLYRRVFVMVGFVLMCSLPLHPLVPWKGCASWNFLGIFTYNWVLNYDLSNTVVLIIFIFYITLWLCEWEIAAVFLLSPLTGKVQGRSNTNQVLLTGILCFYHRSSVEFN